MTKRIAAKYKIDRRLGCNLWGRPKSPFNKRNSRPGQHGSVGHRRKQSDYSLQGFKKAISDARNNNQPTFIYKGKLYSTRLDN